MGDDTPLSSPGLCLSLIYKKDLTEPQLLRVNIILLLVFVTLKIFYVDSTLDFLVAKVKSLTGNFDGSKYVLQQLGIEKEDEDDEDVEFQAEAVNNADRQALQIYKFFKLGGFIQVVLYLIELVKRTLSVLGAFYYPHFFRYILSCQLSKLLRKGPITGSAMIRPYVKLSVKDFPSQDIALLCVVFNKRFSI